MVANPNFSQVGRSSTPKPPVSPLASRVQTFAQDAPRTVAASPETAGLVAQVDFTEGEQFSLSTMLESAAWARDVESRWELANDEQRNEFWASMSDEDRVTLTQFSDISEPQSFLDRVKANLKPTTFVRHRFNEVMRVLNVVPDAVGQTYRTLEGGEDETGQFFGAFGNWTHYWRRAGTNEGRFYGSRVDAIAERAGWSENETQFFVDMGLKFGRNYMMREDPQGISNAVTETLLEHVTEYGMDPQDALELHQSVMDRLDDPEQFEAINELVGSRMSLGRGMARNLGLDPLEDRRLFSTVSGTIDILPQLVDPTYIGGKLLKTYRWATRGVAHQGDVAYRMVGARNAERVLQLADEAHNGNVADAVVDLARSDEAWATFDGASRRLVDTVQQALNEDLLAAARARTAGGFTEAAGTGGFARDRVASRLLTNNPDSVLGGWLRARGARVTERAGGTTRLAKLNPLLADVATTVRDSIRTADEAAGTVRIQGAQQADGIADNILRYSREDVVRAVLDRQFASRVVQGHFAGHMRHVPVMPGVGVMSSKTEGAKLLMRTGIDWLNDSNFRLVSRLVRAGRFGEYRVAEDGTEVLTEEAQRALDQAGTTVRFGQALRGLPGQGSGTRAVGLDGRVPVQATTAAFTQSVGKILTMFTRTNPGRVIDLADDKSIHQVGQLASLLPPSVADTVVQSYAASRNLGQRVAIFRGLVDEVFTRIGVYESPLGQQIANEYLGKQMTSELVASGMDETAARTVTGQLYSASGLDEIGGGFSAALYGYQTSAKLSIPEFSKLHALSRKGAFWSKILGVDLLNSNTADKVVSGFWAPSVLARPGFPLRAGGEEALQFILREGGLRYLRGQVTRMALRRAELTAGRAARSTTARSIGVRTVGNNNRSVVDRRGNPTLMWVAEMLDHLPGTGALADNVQRNLNNANYLLGSAWVGRTYEVVSRVGHRFGNAREELLRFLAGRQVYDAAAELVERNPEFRELLMGDISGQTMSGSKFLQRQIGGSDDLPEGMRRRALDDQLEAFNIFATDTGRAQLLDQDSPEFFTHFRDQMIAPFQSEAALDQTATRLVDDIVRDVAPDGRFTDQRLDRIVENFQTRMRQEFDASPVLQDEFERMWRGSQMPDGRIVVDSGDRFSTVFKDPNVIGWHGTRNAIPLDNLKVELADRGDDALQAVQGVRELEARVRFEEDVLREWEELGGGTGASDIEKMAIGDYLRDQLRQAPESVDMRLNRLRWLDVDFDKTGVEFYDDVQRQMTAARDRVMTHTEELARAKEELKTAFDVDVDEVQGKLSEAERTQLGELRTSLDTLNQQLRDGAPPQQLQELLDAKAEVVERIQLLEYRQSLQGRASGPAGTNNLRALALQNRRSIDPRLGTGGQWYGRGTYLAADEIDDAATYALDLAEEASDAARIYGFGFDGDWNPIDMDDVIPQDAFREVKTFVTELVASLDPAQMYLLDETLGRLAIFADVTRLSSDHVDAVRRLVRETWQTDELLDSWVAYRRFHDANPVVNMDLVVNGLDETLLQLNIMSGMAWKFPTAKQSPLWDEGTQIFTDRLAARGYTGFEHTDLSISGKATETKVRVVWDSDKLTGIHELDPQALRDRAKNSATMNEAFDDWSSRVPLETLRRVSLQRNGQPTRLPDTELLTMLRNGEAPTLEQLREWNYADDGSTLTYDPEALGRRLVELEQLARDRHIEQTVPAWERSDSFSDIDPELLDGPAPEREVIPTETVTLADETLREQLDGLEALQGKLAGFDTALTQDQVDELREVVEAHGLTWNYFDDLFTQAPRERLATETIAPLSELERKAWYQRMWRKPFSVISRAIDTISRDPMYLLNYAKGLEFADTFYWTNRADQHRLYQAVKSIDGSSRVSELDKVAARRPGGKMTVEEVELGNSIAKVNLSTRTVQIDRVKLRADYDDGLTYLTGNDITVGSRQKAEVMARLGVDTDELKAWLDDNGGVAAYERLILAHEQAHLDLGHKGVHSGDWMTEGAIHQELEAQYVAMRRIGAGHLTGKPFTEDVTVKGLLGVLDDTRAAYRRLNKGADPGAKLGSDDLTDMLRDHPLWDQLEKVADEARDVGFVQGEEDTFAFLHRVLTRVDETLDERHVLAAQWAFNQTRPHVDSVAISSFGTSLLRNAVPFQWAAERFIKRSFATAFHSPDALKKLHLTYLGMHQVGIIDTDENGEDYFVYPATQLLYDGVAQVLGVVFGGGLRTPTLVDENGDPLPDDLGLAEMVQMRGRTIQALPGLDDLGRPMLGPFMAVPLRFVANRFPSAAGAVEALIGPISANEQRPAWSLLVPSVVYNLSRMVDPYENYAHASLQAFQTLAANGMLPDDTDPGAWDEFNDRLEHQMQILAGLRVVYGFAGIAPAQIEFSGSEVQQELVKLIEIHGFEDGFLRWQEQHPDATAWQVFGTTTEGGATLPATEETFQFLTDNAEMAETYQLATPYLVPKPADTGQGSEFFNRAWSQQFAMELRRHRTVDEMYEAVRYAQVAPAYFAERDQYRALRETVKGTPEAAALDAQWGQRQVHWQTSHPTFWNVLTSNEREQKRRNIVAELRAVRDNGIVPNTTAAVATYTMLEGYDQFEAQMNALRGIRTEEARAAREFYRHTFAQWAYEVAMRQPEAESFYYRVVVPELSLDDEVLDQIQAATPVLTAGG